MLVAAIANIILSLIILWLGGSVLSAIVGITLVPWAISAVISLIAMLGYQRYTEIKYT